MCTREGFWDGLDWGQVLAWVFLCVLAGFSLFWLPDARAGIGKMVVVLANVYIWAELIFAGLKNKRPIPNLFPALFVVLAIFLGVLFGFASIYIDSRGVDTQLSPNISNGVIWLGGYRKLSDPLEALYFSLTTFTTFGSEFTVLSGWAKFCVAAELLTALNLLLFAFPILVSRLAMFEEGTTAAGTRVFFRINKDTGKVDKSDTNGEPDANTYVVDLVVTPTFTYEGRKPVVPRSSRRSLPGQVLGRLWVRKNPENAREITPPPQAPKNQG